MKALARWLLTVFMVVAGLNHFMATDVYVAIMPKALPAHRLLVYVSGIAEIAFGLGLIFPRTRRLAAWGLILLLIAIFPANVNMAANHLPFGDRDVPVWALWMRLPLQLVLILWAWWFTRPEPGAGRSTH